MRVPFLQDTQAVWGQVPAPVPTWGSGAPQGADGGGRTEGLPGGPTLQPSVFTVSPCPRFKAAGVCQAC